MALKVYAESPAPDPCEGDDKQAERPFEMDFVTAAACSQRVMGVAGGSDGRPARTA